MARVIYAFGAVIARKVVGFCPLRTTGASGGTEHFV